MRPIVPFERNFFVSCEVFMMMAVQNGAIFENYHCLHVMKGKVTLSPFIHGVSLERFNNSTEEDKYSNTSVG